MTRGQIKTVARKKLGEATAVFFTEDDLNQWFTDGCIDVVWKSRCKRVRTLCSTIASTLRYDLNTLIPNCLRIISVRIYSSSNTQWRRLCEKTYDFLDQAYPQWESYSAAVPLYYVYDRQINNTGELILFPMAQSDYVGTNYLEVYNSQYPTVLTNDAQTPSDIPTMLQQAIIEWIVATGLEARGYQDIADNHWTKYNDKLVSYLTQNSLEEDEEICMHGE